jgi:hypothetical protein
MPRKLTYTEALGAKICATIAAGRSVRAACTEHAVPRRTFTDWTGKYSAFAEAVEAAKAEGIEALRDQIETLADQAQGIALAGGTNANALVNALRVEIDTKKWLLARLAPGQFGDRVTSEITGAGGKDLIPPAIPDRGSEEGKALLTKISLILLGEITSAPGGKNYVPPPPTPLRALAGGKSEPKAWPKLGGNHEGE